MQVSSSLKIVQRVSLINALGNILLAIVKIIVGWISHSQALLADGLHSFSDLASDALVYIGAHAGEKRPDLDHPYGHHRIETIIAIIIALVFLLIGVSIIRNSLQHIIQHTQPIIHTVPVLIIAGMSIVINEGLFRYTLKAGKRIHSHLLITNAWHKRGDAFSSMIVLLSSLGTYLHLIYLDLIGAIVIALLILKMSLIMIYNNVNELIDSAVDPDTLEKIHDAILMVNGVTDVHKLRTRLHAGHIFIDAHILVDPTISISEGHYISDQVAKTLSEQFSKILDITVHVDPEDDEITQPSVYLPNRKSVESLLRERWKTLPGYDGIYRIIIHYLNGKLHIETFMKAPLEQLSYLEQQLTVYRAAVVDLPYIEKIDMHITL